MKTEKWWESETKEQLVDRLIAKSEIINKMRIELGSLYKQLAELKPKDK